MKPLNIGLAILTAFLFAIQPLLAKYLLQKYSRHFVYVIQVIIQIILISVYICYYNKQLQNDFKKLTRSDFILFFITVFLCIFLTNILFYHLVNEENPSIVTSLIYSAPIISLLIGVIILENEKFSLSKGLGCLLGVIGVILVVI